MHRFLSNRSLPTQLVLVGIAGVIVSAAALAVFASSASSTWLFVMMMIAGALHVALLTARVRHVLRPLGALRRGMSQVIAGNLDADSPAADTMQSRDLQKLTETFDRMVDQLREARQSHRKAQQHLAEQTQTVDRMLEFSQTIQGAGKPDQIFATLCHYLQSELGLAGLVILGHEPDSMPATNIKAHWPADLIHADRSAADLEASLCPCLRQNLPRHFKPDAPVRCSVDSLLRLGPDHPAYCVPFNIGRTLQVLVHMLLPVGQAWTEERKQLAHTYITTAYSSLITLHHLQEAEKQSMTDGLTGLFNRRSMDNLLQREVALAERHGHALSVVMIDMDKFKEVNDAHGHAAGDHMLRAFADCVRMTLRKTDLAFRYGGDEFVIALPQTPLVQAQQVVQKLRQAFNAVDFSDAITNLDHQPTLSVGVTERSSANNVLTLPALLASADQALYDAKNNNRDCVRVYQPPHAA